METFLKVISALTATSGLLFTLSKIIPIVFSKYRDRIEFTIDRLLLRDITLISLFCLIFSSMFIDTFTNLTFAELIKDYIPVIIAVILVMWFIVFVIYYLTFKVFEQRKFYKIEIDNKTWYIIRALNKEEILLHNCATKDEVNGLVTMTIKKEDLINKPLEYYIKPRKKKN